MVETNVIWSPLYIHEAPDREPTLRWAAKQESVRVADRADVNMLCFVFSVFDDSL